MMMMIVIIITIIIMVMIMVMAISIMYINSNIIMKDIVTGSLSHVAFLFLYRVSQKICLTFDQILKNNDNLNRLTGR